MKLFTCLLLIGCTVETDGIEIVWTHDRLYDERPEASSYSRLTVWPVGEHCTVSDKKDGNQTSEKLIGYPADGFDPWFHSRRDNTCVFEWRFKR